MTKVTLDPGWTRSRASHRNAEQSPVLVMQEAIGVLVCLGLHDNTEGLPVRHSGRSHGRCLVRRERGGLELATTSQGCKALLMPRGLTPFQTAVPHWVTA